MFTALVLTTLFLAYGQPAQAPQHAAHQKVEAPAPPDRPDRPDRDAKDEPRQEGRRGQANRLESKEGDKCDKCGSQLKGEKNDRPEGRREGRPEAGNNRPGPQGREMGNRPGPQAQGREGRPGPQFRGRGDGPGPQFRGRENGPPNRPEFRAQFMRRGNDEGPPMWRDNEGPRRPWQQMHRGHRGQGRQFGARDRGCSCGCRCCN